MDSAVNSASIAISISMGLSLLVGLFSTWIAMRSVRGAAGQRDTVVAILFGIAGFIVVLNATAAGFIAIGGMAYFGLLKATLLLTSGFAALGMVFGVLRELRSGRAIRTYKA